ncbi:MAG: type II toxin-antitoxin system PemK/MazF family toxin [Thermodesulfobacteriota bacterium]
MAKFVKGDVVVVPFPFSDLTQAKRRPAFVIAVLEGNDLILCQVTSKLVRDKYAISIGDDDFSAGGLKQISNVRPNRIFTADSGIILYRVGTLRDSAIKKIIDRAVEIIRS